MLIIYILLGIIQGLTEVLPISSSARLIIFENLFGIKFDNLGFEVLLHIASLLAIIIYLRKELIDIVIGSYKYIIKKDKNYKDKFMLLIYMMISTIPIVITTIIIKSLNIKLYSLLFVSIMLIINSFLLFSIKTYYNKNDNLNFKNAMIIGLCQSVAIFPGISRSGSCLFGGYVSKLNKEDSKRYAFLLFIPSVIGGTFVEFKNIKDIFMLNNNMIFIIIITMIITFITTYISFKLINYLINKEQINKFGYYTLLLGIITLILSIKFGVM